MSLLNRMKQNLARRAESALPVAPEEPQRSSYTLSLPNPFGGAPLCQATVAVTTTRHAEGESVRMQAFVDSHFRSHSTVSDAAVLEHGRASGSLMLAGRSAAHSLARRGLSSLPIPERRVRTWIDVQASTAPLAAGAEALLPERLRELCGGGVPRGPAGEPRVGVFAGPAGGASYAQLGLLQLDQEDLPEPYRDRPFSLLASVASLSEPPADDGSDTF